jgi:uncharacterized membrane protein YvlD (DUF360 family)
MFAGDQSVAGSWARAIEVWLVALVVPAFGILVAARVLPDFRLTGPTSQQLLAVVVTTVLFVTGNTLLRLPVNRAVGRAQFQTAQAMSVESEEWQYAVSARRLWLLTGVSLAVTVVVVPTMLWLATSLSGWFGLPVRLSGFWPTVVGALVIAVVTKLCGMLLVLLRGLGPARRAAAWGLVEYVATLVALWLVVSVLGDDQPGSGLEQHLLTLFVLAGIFTLVQLQFTAPGLTLIVLVAINVLKLVVVGWLSTWLDAGLEISGFWTFLLAAVFLMVATGPVRLASQPR